MPGATPLPPVIVVKRKKVEGGHHGGAWKVAYADFVTAMMAFFMLLWLISSPDKDRLRGIARYFSPTPPTSEAGSGTGKQLSDLQPPSVETSSSDKPADRSPSLRPNTRAIAVDVMTALLERGMDDVRSNVRVEPAREGTRIELMDTADRPLFRAGTSEPNAYGRLVLTVIGERLGARGGRLAIEGHSDGVGGLSGANWRLSGARADAARAIIEAAGVPADRIAEVVARAATRPIFPEDPARAENRRVTLVVLSEAGPVPDPLG